MGITSQDRQDMTRALATAIACANCGKQERAEAEGRALIRLLIATGIITDAVIGFGDLR